MEELLVRCPPDMEDAKKPASHIRERIVFNEETASQPLDTYYKLHVHRHYCRSRNPQAEWLRRFQRTHYFGPNYWLRQRGASLTHARRLEDLRRQIREAKEVIEYKSKLDLQERWLEQLTARLAQQAFPKAAEAPQVRPESPKTQLQSHPQPLVLMIGDEVLYDEEYKWDPLWRQDEEEGAKE